MTTFYVADDDGHGPSIWAKDQILRDRQLADAPVLRRCDMAPESRRFWDDIVARMTGRAVVEDPMPERWCCDGCLQMVTRPEIADMVDYEHVLCHGCVSAQYDIAVFGGSDD